jgi:hypothetical protein
MAEEDTTSHDNGEVGELATGTASILSLSDINLQEGSRFVNIRQELRDKIYGMVFYSTRLASGTRDGRPILSARHVLALLRVCRQIHREIGLSWLTQVQFSFESPEAMLNKLAPNVLPQAKLSLIRQVQVSGRPLHIKYQANRYYRLSGATSRGMKRHEMKTVD